MAANRESIVNNTSQQSRPVVWSIAASDSGGGAGIQADLNTIHSLECHGCTVITAITAQNSVSVEKVRPLSAVDLAAQWQALEKDLLPQAIKIGLLPEPSTLRWLARHIDKLRSSLADKQPNSRPIFCVWDPVLKASTGARFLDAFDRGEINPLLKQVDLVTPNLQEAEMLTKIKIQSFSDIQLAAKQLLDRGAKSVLIKGGHSFDNSDMCRDYFVDKDQSFWVCHAKQDQPNNHGTGCSLASAIASFIAKGSSLSDSIVLANRFIQQGLRLAAPQGQGAGPVWQSALTNNPDDLPELIKSAAHFKQPRYDFPIAEDLRLYAIVDNISDLTRLIKQGVNTLQWRDKTSDNQDTLKQAISMCKSSSTPLYINDNWQLALEFDAYGIHLGQEDLTALSDNELQQLRKHNIRLGISCHNETELAYAHSLKPSYLAFGPVFSPKSKVVDHPPLGPKKLQEWQASYGKIYPTTCIGGIELDNIKEVLESGITSVASISAFSDEPKTAMLIKSFHL